MSDRGQGLGQEGEWRNREKKKKEKLMDKDDSVVIAREKGSGGRWRRLWGKMVMET